MLRTSASPPTTNSAPACTLICGTLLLSGRGPHPGGNRHGSAVAVALAMPKVVTGVFKGILLFMLLAGETFNRFDVRITLPQRAGGEASDA